MMWVVDISMRSINDINNRSQEADEAHLFEFQEPGSFYKFPRNAEGEMIYCNVEGIMFLGDGEVV